MDTYTDLIEARRLENPSPAAPIDAQTSAVLRGAVIELMREKGLGYAELARAIGTSDLRRWVLQKRTRIRGDREGEAGAISLMKATLVATWLDAQGHQMVETEPYLHNPAAAAAQVSAREPSDRYASIAAPASLVEGLL